MIQKQKTVLIFFLVFLLLIPGQAFAQTSYFFGYFGTTSQTRVLYASETDMTDRWTSVVVDGEGTGEILWYKGQFDANGDFSESELSRSAVPGTRTAPQGANGFRLLSKDGKEIYAMIGYTTNTNAQIVNFSKGYSSSDDGTYSGGSGGSGCIGCEMFNCPGWGDYMEQLTQIKNAIPPAPNWQTVSETFRDTIAPQIKADLISVIGTTEDAPGAPIAPTEPPMLSDLDNGGITAPTGQEAPGLEDATFSEDDIKNEATPIQVREDESGGFDITDPLASFPTQEEFLANKPTEGTIPMPGEPKKDENKPPAPPAIPTGSAPIPTDNTGSAPIPTDNTGSAPTPTGSTGSPPIPGGSTGSAPKPTDGLANYPIPGS